MSLQGGSYQSPWSSQTGLSELDVPLGELEPVGELAEVGFEPQTRARSNTWPLPRPDNFVENTEDTGSKKNSNQNLSGAPPLPSSAVTAKKNSSRRNAWGNLSYADLITQAITSSPDSRLTLSQIYEWMVQNVPYFKDKGDSNSSAGWKNSIRHNLSLHNRFMRVQNEGTGKSSWWMINPDAKPGKSVRRRAASMETSKYEKRRGRAKKKAEAIRNGVTADTTPSPSSSVSEGLDMFPDSPMHNNNFQLSPDFRQRASSNASSVGRLSPIQSLMTSDPDWATEYTPAGDFTQTSDFSQADYAQAEQLAGSLADAMKLQGADPFLNTYVPTTSSSSSGGSYRYASYATCPRHPHGGCTCAMYSQPAHPAHPTHPHQHALDHFVRPPPPADPADIMQTESTQTQIVTSDAALMNGGMMVETGAVPTTVMGQIMGALNTTNMAEDLNFASLEPGIECNVDEVIKHELSMDGSLDFHFPQQHTVMAAEAESQFVMPAPPVPTTLSGGGAPRPPYSVAPSWVH